MPSIKPEETRPEKTVRQHFDTRNAEHILHAAEMSKDRSMLRRGAMKLQDGTLGKAGNPDSMDDEMNIRVGDETVNNYHAAPDPTPVSIVQEKPKSTSLLPKIALAAALLGAGSATTVGGLWALGAFDKPVMEAPVDNDTEWQSHLSFGR